MQTFLPYPDFEQSAKVLDRQRLGKQRVEAYQLLKGILQSYGIISLSQSSGNENSSPKTPGWTKHPASIMWRRNPHSLLAYCIAMCDDWKKRGYVSEGMSVNIARMEELLLANSSLSGIFSSGNPTWLGDERVHSSHRGRLLYKYPEHYSVFGWTESPLSGAKEEGGGYFWPILPCGNRYPKVILIPEEIW